MGFKSWFEALVFTGIFGVIVLGPCFLVAVWGSKMINDLGNFPTRAAQIQANAGWKIFLVEMAAFFLLAAFFHFFN